MRSWDVFALDGLPGPPQILSTTSETRTIVLGLAAGERLAEHRVHERALIVVLSGDVRFTDAQGRHAAAEPGTVVELEPGERHAVLARADARLLLVLAPWPGPGHPGTMTLQEKAHAREHASEHARRAASRPAPSKPAAMRRDAG